tara:strand:+ start:2006 stop:2500 length:495 start_codon:yes stop_codon:yes gene_type:complete
MVVKIKKTKKVKGQRGKRGHGWGAKKKHKGSGHRGGFGMAGTGKRADHKKTLINKLYGKKYFGKQGITSKRTAKRKSKTINLKNLVLKFKDKTEINLKDYKILGDGEITRKITITAKAFTKSAKAKIEKAGGKIIVPIIKKKEVKKVESKKQQEEKADDKEVNK